MKKMTISTENLGIDESEEYFGPLFRFVKDDDITDVDFNGTDLWLTNSKNVRYHSDEKLEPEFVEQFTKRVANAVSKAFHKQQPILEAETPRLRITVVHESVAISGRSICIRKSLPYVRMTEEGMLREKYCAKEVLNLLRSCIISKQNIVFCGEPGAGKTECAKFFSQYIPANERVITIEDNPEWHYKEINPEKDCIELKVGKQMDYTAAIKTCLRLNPKWMMLSESRSTEILKLLEGFSTGVKGITTLHANDVRAVPDRMVNMGGQARNESRMENDIYSFIDLAVLIRRKEVTEEDGSRRIRRYIDQLCYFERVDGENRCHMIVEDGALLTRMLPKGLLRKFEYAGLPDPMDPEQEEYAFAPVVSAGSTRADQVMDGAEKPGMDRDRDGVENSGMDRAVDDVGGSRSNQAMNGMEEPGADQVAEASDDDDEDYVFVTPSGLRSLSARKGKPISFSAEVEARNQRLQKLYEQVAEESNMIFFSDSHPVALTEEKRPEELLSFSAPHGPGTYRGMAQAFGVMKEE